MSGLISAIGVFCEDIRSEQGGTDSLVGIYPDNVEVASVPGNFPKLSLYIRIHLSPTAEIPPMKWRLTMADGTDIQLGDIDIGTIKKAQSESIRDGNPIAGLISRARIAPFPVTKIGRIRAIISVGDNELLVASLNVKLAAIASEPQP